MKDVVCWVVAGAILVYAIKSRGKPVEKATLADIKENFSNSYIGPHAVYHADFLGWSHPQGQAFMYNPEATVTDVRTNAIPELPPRMYAGDYSRQLKGPVAPAHLKAAGKYPIEELYQQSVPSNVNDRVLNALEMGQHSTDQLNFDMYRPKLEFLEASQVVPQEDMAGISYGAKIADPDTYVKENLMVGVFKKRNGSLTDTNPFLGDVPISHKGSPDGWFKSRFTIPPNQVPRGFINLFAGPDISTHIDEELDVMVTNNNWIHGAQFKPHM